MSHMIRYITYPETADKRMITADIMEEVESAEYEEGGGLLNPIRWIDVTLDTYQDAEDYIKAHDKGWYDNLAVKYRYKDLEGEEIICWLVKYEYHV